jgi:hypothetical protein
MSKMGRPTLHGLKVITGERIRKSRIAMASGSSRKKIAEDIFKVSPRTFRRLLATDHPMAKALKQAVKDGELLKGEPLGHLLCMLIDRRDSLMIKRSELLISETLPDGATFMTSKGCSDEEEEVIFRIREQVASLEDRIRKAVSDNDELKQYLKHDGRKKNENYDLFKADSEFIQLNKITEDLGIDPLQTDDYLYKEN